jgi:hypothetical protein
MAPRLPRAMFSPELLFVEDFYLTSKDEAATFCARQVLSPALPMASESPAETVSRPADFDDSAAELPAVVVVPPR